MKCCFCEKEITGYGNNPWPLVTDRESRCCDDCNRNIVIPERVKRIMKRNEEYYYKKRFKKE